MKASFRSLSLLAISGLTGLVVTSCAKGGPDNQTVAPLAAIQHDSTGWRQTQYTVPDHTVILTKSEMNEKEQEETKKSYRQTDLIPVPADPKYNVQLFKIRNVDEYKDTVFIAPRLYAYGSAQHGHVAPKKNADGSVSLSLPLALIDGIQSEITGADDNDKIDVPDNLRVQHVSDLASELNGRFGRTQILSVLPGCPKKIVLSVNDQDYNVTPSGMANSDYCQINKAIQAPLRVSADDAKYIFQDALYAGVVQARAEFETLVAFTTANLSIEFDKQKVFSDLEAELAITAPPYADVDVHTKLTNILRNQVMKIHFQGDMTAAIENIVNQATKTFFEPFNPDPNTHIKACGDKAIVCLRLNYNYSKEVSAFQFTWQQSTTALTGQIYTTLAKMQPVQDREIEIGIGNRPTLKNDNKLGFETGLTVVAGAQIEIKPSSILLEQRDLDIPNTARQNNNVCVRQHEIIIIPNHGHGHGGDSDDLPIHTGRYECDQYENRWTDITTYSMSNPTMVQMNQPEGTVEVLYEGLALNFHWGSQTDGTYKSTTCPLNVFERVGQGDSVVVTLANRPGCQVFSEDSANRPMLSLVNNIHYLKKFKTGRFARQWNGAITENPIDGTYDPQVAFAGKIGVRGFEMMSILSSRHQN